MKKIFILLLAFLVCFISYADEMVHPLSIEQIEGRWSIGIEDSELKLKKDGTYLLGHPMRDGFFASGTWCVEKNEIIRIEYPNKIENSDRAEYKQKVLNYLFPETKSRDFIFDENYKTFNFSGCLKSEELILIDPYKRRSPANQEYELSGVKVIKLENSFIVSSENMKLRGMPSLNGSVEKTQYSIFGNLTGKTSILIKKYPVTVDAVTVEKEKIDGIMAPWYRIQLSGGDEAPEESFWIWGGYSEYYETMDKYRQVIDENADSIFIECKKYGWF